MTQNNVIETPNFVLEKKKKSIKRRRIQLAIFLTVVAIMMLILLFMFTNISYVKSVSVNPTMIQSEKAILKKANIKKSDRIYAIDPNNIASEIEYLDGVKSVEVKRHFPNKVSIQVNEFKVVGMLKDGSIFHPILENGQILKKVEFKTPYDAPEINDFTDKSLNQLVKVLVATKPDIINHISEINFVPNVEASSRIQLFMKDGIEVIGDLRTIQDKLNYYPSMAKNIKKDANGKLVKPGLIDLEVGAVFIPYESKKAETRRIEMESEMKAKSEKEKSKVESAVNDLKNQLNEVKASQSNKDTTKDSTDASTKEATPSTEIAQ
ncbi:cell division protein FtsQ/DivIB [Macrococcus sp. DPC7161]|uniref:cell division protein FtsQ/DivIB n=1 Tax=Macrococcus sp. DPC7161 TaxID=2507060 RepID=UPI00100B7496|nr:FtsQ-type POTRA domain-containing protein [Macrococcus sp. DPC7161]RXK18889.1 FtsQ-type POTRA domain-containing protein [Macrococcus sp. DPC7161]